MEVMAWPFSVAGRLAHAYGRTYTINSQLRLDGGCFGFGRHGSVREWVLVDLPGD